MAADAEGAALLRADGASRGNPGEAAYGYLIYDCEGRVLAQEGRYLGRMTNNEAEYHGLLAGLRRAQALGLQRLDVQMDSELVVRQMLGQYRVKAANLLPLYREARQLIAAFRGNISHVRRGGNAAADRLANLALDERARQR